ASNPPVQNLSTVLIGGTCQQDGGEILGRRVGGRPFAPRQDCCLVSCYDRIEGRRPHPLKTSMAIVLITGQLSAAATADDQILMSIPIHVKPAYARAELAQAARQQWLALEVIERRLM